MTFLDLEHPVHPEHIPFLTFIVLTIVYWWRKIKNKL